MIAVLKYFNKHIHIIFLVPSQALKFFMNILTLVLIFIYKQSSIGVQPIKLQLVNFLIYTTQYYYRGNSIVCYVSFTYTYIIRDEQSYPCIHSFVLILKSSRRKLGYIGTGILYIWHKQRNCVFYKKKNNVGIRLFVQVDDKYNVNTKNSFDKCIHGTQVNSDHIM